MDKINYFNSGLRLSEEALESAQNAVNHNNAVGTITGYYDEQLTILSVSQVLFDNLGYSEEEFMKISKCSLRKLFYGENRSLLEPERFPVIKGAGEGEMLTKDGTPVTVRLYKEDDVDKNGTPVWILSVRVDWERENLTLVNGAIKSGLWYFDCDKNGEIKDVHWSHAFRKILGYHDILDFPNELSSWSDLLYDADKEKTLNRLKDAIADKTNNTKYDVEYRLKMLDGTYQWFRAKFTKTNLCEYYVNLKENVFDSMKNETSMMSIFEKNNTWDELISDYIENYVCEEDRQEVSHFYKRDYITKRLSKIDSELSLECRIILDGDIRWVRNVILRGEKKKSDYAIIFIRDITDAKREAEINKRISADSEAMGHLIKSVTRLVDHFAICDLENDSYEYSVIKIKAEYQSRGKYSEFIKAVTGKFKTLESSESLELILSPQNLRNKLIDENEIYKFEYCSLDEDCYRSASFIPLEWKEGNLTKVLWVSMDITQEKKQEIIARNALKDAYQAAERANKAKTEFLTNMSHDIRTPMNAIVGLTAIAGANVASQDKTIECLSKITTASRHLLGLINEVLDMARIESGRVSLVEEFNFSELVDNLVTLVKPSVDEHKHNLQVHVKNIDHEDVYGDTLRIQQVFVNLMSNAIKYTPDGGNIVFSIKEKENAQSELGCYEFCIEDDGIGMDEEFQKVMFQPFTRADDRRTTKVQGTGLGMEIT